MSTFKLFCKIYGITAFLAHNVLYYVYYYGFYWLLEHGINVKRFIAFFFQMPTFAPYINSIPDDTRAASLAIAAVLTTIILPLRIFVTCLVSVPIVHFLRGRGLMKPAKPIITANLKSEDKGKFDLNPPYHDFPEKCPTKYDWYFEKNKGVIYTLPFYDRKAKIIDNSYRKMFSDKITEQSMRLGRYLYSKCEIVNEYLRKRRERRRKRIVMYLNNKKNIIKMSIKRYIKNKKDKMYKYIRRKANKVKDNIKNAVMNKIRGKKKVTSLIKAECHALAPIVKLPTAIQKIEVKNVNSNSNISKNK